MCRFITCDGKMDNLFLRSVRSTASFSGLAGDVLDDIDADEALVELSPVPSLVPSVTAVNAKLNIS